MLKISTLLSLLTTSVLAAPAPATISSLPQYFSPPNTVFAQVNHPAPESFGPLNFAARVGIAKNYLVSQLGGDYDITSSHSSDHNGLTYVYLRQHHNGLPVVNSVANVAIDSKGSVFTAGHLNEAPKSNEFTTDVPSISKIDAVISAVKALGENTADLKSALKVVDNKVTGLSIALSPVPIELNYFLTEDSKLELVYTLSIEEKKRWMQFFVSAKTGQVISTSNWVHDFGGATSTSEPSPEPTSDPSDPSTPPLPAGQYQYRVVAFNRDNPKDDGTSLVLNPADSVASPKGWHNAPDASGHVDSRGNNVAASVDGWSSSKYAKSIGSGSFDYKFDLSKDPSASQDAAITNVFHLANHYHDLMYHYGFTEQTGNFQNDNFGKGGYGGDAILASVQNSEGMNNANFAAPPDGTAGKMNMYLFDQSTPHRDGDMENAVVIHEMTHGLSNRLTGGSATANCLQTTESGGMGEGWSDVIAFAVSMRSSDTRSTDRPTGEWVMSNPRGIRRFPYSTDTNTNPHKYSDLKSDYEVHNIGETWATMLYEVYWNMVDMSGFSDELMVDNKVSGNQRFMQLVVDGFKLQPCNPTFVQARDAILAADKANYNSKYQCAIWKAFAKRGLGVGAKNHNDSNKIPEGC